MESTPFIESMLKFWAISTAYAQKLIFQDEKHISRQNIWIRHEISPLGREQNARSYKYGDNTGDWKNKHEYHGNRQKTLYLGRAGLLDRAGTSSRNCLGQRWLWSSSICTHTQIQVDTPQ